MKKLAILLFLLMVLGGLWFYQNYFSGKNTVTEIPKLGDMPVYVADQRPSSFINIAFGTLIKPGFVVIHENDDGKFGKIIGNSRILPAGNFENLSIGLVRLAIHGDSLFAVIYEDSGDNIFSPELDLPSKDDKKDIMFYQFRIDSNAPKAQPSPAVSTNPDLSDKIKLDELASGQPIKSPLIVTGQARGYWFFEASFPVKIYDANGTELGVVPAQAQPDPVTGEINWMTENFVPFKAILYFKKPATSAGTLVLEKENPSGLAENAAELRVPVSFDLSNWTDSVGSCKITGCSNQLCVDEAEGDVVTTCEYRDEYACYKTAKCERQEDGKCGWTPSESLISCLRSAWEAEQ